MTSPGAHQSSLHRLVLRHVDIHASNLEASQQAVDDYLKAEGMREPQVAQSTTRGAASVTPDA